MSTYAMFSVYTRRYALKHTLVQVLVHLCKQKKLMFKLKHIILLRVNVYKMYSFSLARRRDQMQ